MGAGYAARAGERAAIGTVVPTYPVTSSRPCAISALLCATRCRQECRKIALQNMLSRDNPLADVDHAISRVNHLEVVGVRLASNGTWHIVINEPVNTWRSEHAVEFAG